MPNQILTLGALAGAPPRRNMPPEAVRALWDQNARGMEQQVLPVNLWDLAVNNPVSQYIGEVIGKGAEKVSEYLPENWREQAMMTLPLLVGTVSAKGLTGKAVLEEAAGKGKKLSFADFRRQNPAAGSEMFDLATARPAVEGRPMLPRYDPPRGTPARVAEAVADPKVRKTLRQTVERGGEMMPESWYRTGPLYEHYKRIYGPNNAEMPYALWMNMMAATSPQSRVPDNIRIGSLYNWMAQQGMPFPDKPPAGYGSKAQGLHSLLAGEIMGRGNIDPLKNPKPASFVENLLGNEVPVTIDTHNFRMLGIAAEDPRFLSRSVEVEVPGQFTSEGKQLYKRFNPREAYEGGELSLKDALKEPAYWESAPKETEYLAYERAQQKMAERMGMSPSTFQERMWVGGGEKTGLGSPPEPYLRTLAARIHYTAARMGVSPQVVLEKFVKGEIPLLGLAAGAAVIGSQLPADERQ